MVNSNDHHVIIVMHFSLNFTSNLNGESNHGSIGENQSVDFPVTILTQLFELSSKLHRLALLSFFMVLIRDHQPCGFFLVLRGALRFFCHAVLAILRWEEFRCGAEALWLISPPIDNRSV